MTSRISPSLHAPPVFAAVTRIRSPVLASRMAPPIAWVLSPCIPQPRCARSTLSTYVSLADLIGRAPHRVSGDVATSPHRLARSSFRRIPRRRAAHLVEGELRGCAGQGAGGSRAGNSEAQFEAWPRPQRFVDVSQRVGRGGGQLYAGAGAVVQGGQVARQSAAAGQLAASEGTSAPHPRQARSIGAI